MFHMEPVSLKSCAYMHFKVNYIRFQFKNVFLLSGIWMFTLIQDVMIHICGDVVLAVDVEYFQ